MSFTQLLLPNPTDPECPYLVAKLVTKHGHQQTAGMLRLANTDEGHFSP